jgi:hypothetical protein
MCALAPSINEEVLKCHFKLLNRQSTRAEEFKRNQEILVTEN